jgi:hypothetical protein
MKSIYHTANQTTDQKVGRAINRLRFKSNVYEPYASYDRVFIMVNDVRKLAGMEPMTQKMFNDGIRHCHIFADNYEWALAEFKALIWGDW